VSTGADQPTEAPPVGEEIHLPGPTLLPFLNAIGITFTVIGTTLGLIFVIAGGVLFLVTAGLWIRDTRRDIASLPEEHQH
jgi:hypothetical protein